MKDGLTHRMKMQRGEKPFPHNYCPKSFSTHGSQYIHIKIHTVEKIFPCGKCPKSFFDRSDLKNHLRTYSGEKPYPCVDIHVFTVQRNF